MATIRYTTTHFNQPSLIGETEFKRIKNELAKNSNYQIEPPDESFSEHFSGLFSYMGKLFIGAVVCGILGSALDGSAWMAIFMIPFIFLMLGLVYCVIQIFLEGPSYAKYKKEKREYYSRLRNSIIKASDYDHFVSLFYIK